MTFEVIKKLKDLCNAWAQLLKKASDTKVLGKGVCKETEKALENTYMIF